MDMDTNLCVMFNSACRNLVGHDFKMDLKLLSRGI